MPTGHFIAAHNQTYYLNEHNIETGNWVLWYTHYSCDLPKVIKIIQFNQEIMHITTSQHVDDWLPSRGTAPCSVCCTRMQH